MKSRTRIAAATCAIIAAAAVVAPPAQAFDDGDARAVGQQLEDLLDARPVEIDLVGGDHHGVVDADLVHLREQFLDVLDGGAARRFVVVVQVDMDVDQMPRHDRDGNDDRERFDLEVRSAR